MRPLVERRDRRLLSSTTATVFYYHCSFLLSLLSSTTATIFCYRFHSLLPLLSVIGSRVYSALYYYYAHRDLISWLALLDIPIPKAKTPDLKMEHACTRKPLSNHAREQSAFTPHEHNAGTVLANDSE